MADARTALETADWRRRVFALYAEVRRISDTDPAEAHGMWRRVRDDLFATHPASPLLPEDRESFAGLPVAPYDPAWRFELEVRPDRSPERLEVDTGTDGVVPFERLGSVHLPSSGSGVASGSGPGSEHEGGELDLWRLASYGGGIFLPVKDALSRVPGGTYGGGRYLIDTVKGAHLGDRAAAPGGNPVIVLDFNFAYNPSCAYDPAWACPLAPPGDVLPFPVPVGERMPLPW
jgi:uncharacterized protein (DUF1684 family)